MTSLHIISSFEFIVLQHSVRTSDADFQRLQNIARLYPRHYRENPTLIGKFKELIGRACTFVDNWSSLKITPFTCRLYGEKIPAKKATKYFTLQFRNALHSDSIRTSHSRDIQNPQNSHQEYQTASESTHGTLIKIETTTQTIVI